METILFNSPITKEKGKRIKALAGYKTETGELNAQRRLDT
jgi:hypothetical protein